MPYKSLHYCIYKEKLKSHCNNQRYHHYIYHYYGLTENYAYPCSQFGHAHIDPAGVRWSQLLNVINWGVLETHVLYLVCIKILCKAVALSMKWLIVAQEITGCLWIFAELSSRFQWAGWSSKTEEAWDGGEQQLWLPNPWLRQDSR